VDLGGGNTAFKILEEHYGVQTMSEMLPNIGVTTRGYKYRTPPPAIAGPSCIGLAWELEGNTELVGPHIARQAEGHQQRRIAY
jgi:hypothetical protein